MAADKTTVLLTHWQRYRLRRAWKAERDDEAPGIPALAYSAKEDAVLVGRGLLWRDGERLRITDAGKDAVLPVTEDEESDENDDADREDG